MSGKKIVLSIMAFAMIVRIAMMLINMAQHPDFFALNHQTVQENIGNGNRPFLSSFGYEISNIAYSIVCGDGGFSNPFGGSTGPTGWVAPGMVMLYALVFYAFGCFSPTSLIAMFILSFLLSMLMVLLIYRICIYLFDSRHIGYISAFLFAVSPQDNGFLLDDYQLDFNVHAFLFVLIFYLYVRLNGALTRGNTALFAGAAGVTLLFHPVMLLPIGVCFLLLLLKYRLAAVKHCVISACVICLIIAPYIIHQKNRLGVWTFIKSNGGFEAYIGNTPGFNGVLLPSLFAQKHPGANLAAFLEYKAKGEIGFIRSRIQMLEKNFDPGAFLVLVCRKFFHFFFVYKPYAPSDQMSAFRLARYSIVYAVPGLSLLLYLLFRYKKLTLLDGAVYLYILAYAFPYMFVGIMYRYSFPICPLTTALLGAVLYGCVRPLCIQLNASSQNSL